ncbi:hypothetical protein [Geobacillus stearothermophilus]|uniref:Uncharacterized protein n=1 Tax=Geobacillus stearothermophilus TaxID=1422 RepID=A0A150M8X9_GEOSE|nr:hypothetical protein [Geobacillus stearothermophilus]KYD21023.1 hypothetical protein B4109_3228 [Geobacillus stearothermophilus]
MNDKIRWFKEFYRLDRFTNPNEPYLPSATDISYDDLLWLVEQAEWVEQLQKEKVFWIEKYLQEQAKAERLKNAIKETLETLKRGGPGTRSQVQQLLEKALEGAE